jgi:SAM-dependent methyltransferase
MLDFDKTKYASYVRSWLDGIDNEIAFWDGFFTNGGGQWPQTYERRVARNPSFNLTDFIPESCDWPLRVLDVGAGPISNVGIATDRGPVDLVACDALADPYNDLLERLGIEPYARTRFAIVERLTDVFEEDSFDLVTIENALDHAFDPFIGISEMLRVCRTGGVVHLYHAENEAEHESYGGFHQWNISEQDGTLRIWRPEYSYDVAEMCSGFAEVAATRERVGDLWTIRATLTRTGAVPRTSHRLMSEYDAAVIRYISELGGHVETGGSQDEDSVRQIRSLKAQIESQAAEIERLEAAAGEVSRLSAVIDELHRSTSWRLTAPLRALRAAVGRIGTKS